MSSLRRFPRLVIAGTHSGVGKTTTAMGLMAVLARRLQVQPFKAGPDYIDPAYHTFITGRRSRNLDSWLLSGEALGYLFQKSLSGAHIAIIEGVMGLYDGARPGREEGSTAHVAKILNAPVILVIDGSGMSTSSAALVRGYKDFDRNLDLAGVILNNASNEGHYQILKETIETHTGVRVFGYLPRNLEVELPSRHLGLVPSGEIDLLHEKIEKLADLVSETIDISHLLTLATSWERGFSAAEIFTEPLYPPGTIPLAVAYDEAFNFYYWDNLDLLEELGARLLLFSPRKDESLPEGAAGLILGGGFPEMFAADLQGNLKMRSSVLGALESGMPYIAECGGLMYLLEKLSDLQGHEYTMTGWLRGSCRMTERLQRFGYAELELLKDSVYGPAGQRIRSHEFHHSQIDSPEPEGAFLLRREREGSSEQQWESGFHKGAGVAGYPHLHYYANPQFARYFLMAAHNYMSQKESLAVKGGNKRRRAGAR